MRTVPTKGCPGTAVAGPGSLQGEAAILRDGRRRERARAAQRGVEHPRHRLVPARHRL